MRKGWCVPGQREFSLEERLTEIKGYLECSYRGSIGECAL